MRKRLNGILQLTDINNHWYYDNVAPVARPRGRHAQAAQQPGLSSRRAAQEPEYSTHREPSAFEREGRITRLVTRRQGLAVRPSRVVGGAAALAARTIAARKAQQEETDEEESEEEN
ncbi:MAG: hypothetical protein M1829_002705 [Trizodia sp. TS-e1964]|nr:MAG: hypothetical protein M1829_002705 [Trizodia sp. TS-e1964]